MENSLKNISTEDGVLLKTSCSDILPVVNINSETQNMYSNFFFNLTQDIIESDDVSDENIKRMCGLHVKSSAMLDMDQKCLYQKAQKLLSKFNIKYKLGLQIKKPNELNSSCRKTSSANLNSFTKNKTYVCAPEYISKSEYHKNCYTEYVPYCKSEIIAHKEKARTIGTRKNNKSKIDCCISEKENKTSQNSHSNKIIKVPSVTPTCKRSICKYCLIKKMYSNKTENDTNNDQCKKSNSIDKISSLYNLNKNFSKNYLMDIFTKNYNYIKQLKSVRLNDVNRETQ